MQNKTKTEIIFRKTINFKLKLFPMQPSRASPAAYRYSFFASYEHPGIPLAIPVKRLLLCHPATRGAVDSGFLQKYKFVLTNSIRLKVMECRWDEEDEEEKRNTCSKSNIKGRRNGKKYAWIRK